MHYTIELENLTTTNRIAYKIAQVLVVNFVIALKGDLGSGKTTLTREILRALGVSGRIKSPSFTLVEPYEVNGLNLFHFDLYRFNDALEWFEAGFDEYFTQAQISFIEWAEKAGSALPKIDWQIELKLDQNKRQLTIFALSTMGEQCLKNLINSAAV